MCAGHPVAMSGNTRCQTGRGPSRLLLGFTGECAFEEIRHRCTSSISTPFLPLTFFLFFFHTLPLAFPSALCPSLPLLSSVSAHTAVVSAPQRTEERGPGWLSPGRVGSGARAPPLALSLALSLASFHYPHAAGLACSLSCNHSACFQVF